MKKTLAFASLLVIAAAAFAVAPPSLINYQGVLRDDAGAPINGTVDAVFRLYDAPAAGNLLWQESWTTGTPPQLAVSKGLFNVALGDGAHKTGGSEASLSALFQNNTAVYLEAQIGLDAPMIPRVRVVSSAYALNAGSAASSGNADTLDALDSAQFLRSDVDDTADGVITFSATTTDVRGALVDNDSADTDVNVQEDLYVQGGNVGVGSAPNANYGIYSVVSQSSSSDLFAAYNLAINFDPSAASLYGLFSRANATGVGNATTVYGLSSQAWGTGSSTGDHYGLHAEAAITTSGGSHYGVYGNASGGSTNYGGYFKGANYGIYGTVDENSTATLYGAFITAANADASAGSVYGTSSSAYAMGAGNPKNVYGLSGRALGAASSTGSHTGVYGEASSASPSATHYGVFGIAGGGATNWGLYTPGNAFVGGTLDLGGDTNDDLTAADVTDLTDGGATALHSHDITATGDVRYLRKDMDDTAAGNITFSQKIGVGAAPNSSYGIYSVGSLYGAYFHGTQYGSYNYVNETTASSVYGMYSDTRNYDTGSGNITGAQAFAYAGGANNNKTAYGVVGQVSGIGTGTGDQYGFRGQATTPAAGGTHHGIYAEGNGGAASIGGRFRAGGSFHNPSASTNYGTFVASESAASSGNIYGGYSYGNASAISNSMTTYGLYGKADGVATATGDHYGLRGEATSATAGGWHYGVYGTASGGFPNYGGFFSGTNYGARFEATDTDGAGGVWGGYGTANAAAASNNQSVRGLYGDANGAATSTGTHYGLYGAAGSASPSATHYGVFGTAYGGAVNWGLYTPDAAYVGGNFTVNGTAISLADETVITVGGAAANMTIAGNSLDLFLGDTVSDRIIFYGQALPQTANSQDLGISTQYWDNVYASDYFGKATSIVAFDIYPDLDLLDAMEITPHTDPTTGRTNLIFTNLPPMILGDLATDGEGADQFVNMNKALGFTFGSLRQMRAETKGRDAALRDELDLRTPDEETGKQTMKGNLQIVLDKDVASDSARFSVFRDGKGGLQEEVFRVDEEGNLLLKGALMPNSLDLAEYHPVLDAVEPGDVLVADRFAPGMMRRSALAEDKAVVGIVSAVPGVALGAGVQRLAALEPGLAAQIDDARFRGDKKSEDAFWAQMERRFRETHAAIALSGTVLCKVDAAYGAVEVGDLLVSSPTPGHAMRSDDPKAGTVIGKALEPLSSGAGLVKVLVMLR